MGRNPIRFALDLAAQPSCALCGRAMEPLGSPPWPLCPSCGLSLEPLALPRCAGCGQALISEIGRCARCKGRTWSFDESLPLFPYGGPMGRILAEYKARGRRSLAPFLAGFLAAAIAERWPGRPVVPVPPRPGKLRDKGWDQVELVASELERLGCGVQRPLRRISGSEQKRLGRAERSANASASYALVPGARPPARLVLLDDVATTFATAEACAAALRAGGAESVAFLSLAWD